MHVRDVTMLCVCNDAVRLACCNGRIFFGGVGGLFSNHEDAKGARIWHHGRGSQPLANCSDPPLKIKISITLIYGISLQTPWLYYLPLSGSKVLWSLIYMMWEHLILFFFIGNIPCSACVSRRVWMERWSCKLDFYLLYWLTNYLLGYSFWN